MGGGSCHLFHAHSHFPLGSGDTSSGIISIACCVSSLFKTCSIHIDLVTINHYLCIFL